VVRWKNRPTFRAAPVALRTRAPQRRTRCPVAPNAAARARIPFGTPQLKLASDPRPGFHRRYFNDVPGRIERALNAGYSHVKDSNGNNVTTTVGVAKEGGALASYLMEIPKELFDGDQAAKMQAIDEFDESIRRGVDASGRAPGQDGRYVPVDAYGKPKISLDRR
jgi:hypothetical protein